MLKRPLTVLEGEKGDELEDVALRLFYTIQQHAGKGIACWQGDCMLARGEHVAKGAKAHWQLTSPCQALQEKK